MEILIKNMLVERYAKNSILFNKDEEAIERLVCDLYDLDEKFVSSIE